MDRFLEDFKIGDKFKGENKTILEKDVFEFARITGLNARLHLDEEFAKTTQFGTRIIQGSLVESVVAGLWFQLHLTDSSFIANLGHTTNHPFPTKIGDTLHLEVEVKAIRRSETKPDRGIITIEYVGTNQRNEVVCKTEIKLLLKRRPA